MNLKRLAGGIVFLAGLGMAGAAGAAELKVLSVEAMQPALQQLAPEFESASKHKLKIEYAAPAAIEKKIADEDDYDVVIVDKAIAMKMQGAAKIAGGLNKSVAKKDADHVYNASSTNWTQQPLPAKALIDFLSAPKAAEVYKAKGLQPG